MPRFHCRLRWRQLRRGDTPPCGEWVKDKSRSREWLRWLDDGSEETASVQAGQVWSGGGRRCTSQSIIEVSQETLRQMWSVSYSTVRQMWQLQVSSSQHSSFSIIYYARRQPNIIRRKLHVKVNNNNIQDNVHGAVIMAEPLREFTRFIWWM